MRLANRIVFASLNRHKFEEFRSLFAGHPEIELIPAETLLRNPEKLGLVETHNTYLENAIAKARHANLGCHYPALADDTGLEVDALGGKPGVRSHRYARPPSGAFQMSTEEQDRANRELLLSELKASGGNRKARFTTTVALVIEGILIHAEGVLEGTIADSPRGEHGFGYDPLFVPVGSHKTLAEMMPMEKNAISHRALAIQALMFQIAARGIVFAKP